MEAKHIKKVFSSLLPYGLQIVEDKTGVLRDIDGISGEMLHVKGDPIELWSMRFNEAKPVLYSVEMLMKEILKDDSGSPVPIVRLAEICKNTTIDHDTVKIIGKIDPIDGFFCGVRFMTVFDDWFILSFSEKHGFALQETTEADEVKSRETVLCTRSPEMMEKLYEWQMNVFALKPGRYIRKEEL